MLEQKLFPKPGLKKMSVSNGRLIHEVMHCHLAMEHVTKQDRNNSKFNTPLAKPKCIIFTR